MYNDGLVVIKMGFLLSHPKIFSSFNMLTSHTLGLNNLKAKMLIDVGEVFRFVFCMESMATKVLPILPMDPKSKSLIRRK